MTASAPVTERHLRFRPDIEGLRAVAILLVVLYHAGWHWAASGYLGVDVFFVLSGFLITGLLLDEIGATGTISLVKFWARRARRLLPAAAFITVVVLVLDRVILTPFDQITFAETGRSFAVYGSNILFAIRSTDYFGGAAIRDPLLHTWSLSVEEQFYLFFAPLMLGLAAWAHRRGLVIFTFRFVMTAGCVLVVSLAGCLVVSHHYPVLGFYLLPTRAWEFGLGALTVIGVQRAARLGAASMESLAVVGLIALVASAAIVPAGTTPLGPLTLIPTLGTVAIILSGAAARPTTIGRVLSLAPMRLLGRLSYSWYLWHWPMLVFLRELRPHSSLRLSIAVATLSLIPAALTYAWIESPIRFSEWLRRRPRQTVGAALALAAATYAIAALAIGLANRTLAEPRYQELLDARVAARVYADGCQVPLLAVESPPCNYGPGRNDTTVVLFGDSHAAQWFPTLESVATLRGWHLVNLTKRGCPSVMVGVPNARLGRRYAECDAWRHNTIGRIVTSRPTLVVVSNDRSYNVILGDQQPYTDSSAAARDAWRSGLIQTLMALKPSGARLVVLEDTPQPQIDPPRCLLAHISDPAQCPAPRVAVALDPVVLESERAAVRAVPGVSLISLNRAICDSTTCPLVKDGVVRYQDNSHLSVRFAASLAPLLSQALTAALGPPEHPQ